MSETIIITGLIVGILICAIIFLLLGWLCGTRLYEIEAAKLFEMLQRQAKGPPNETTPLLIPTQQ